MPRFSLLILCAGFGKRMLDLTSNMPKPLLQFNNKVLLGNTIDFFYNIGCDEIIINTHYQCEKIHSYITKNYNNHNIKIIYEPHILGTGGGVKNIFNYTSSKKICVVNSDIFWKKNNIPEITSFIGDCNDVQNCKILLSNKKNFLGLKNKEGDFYHSNGLIFHTKINNEKLYFTGLQILTSDIFTDTNKNFSMNEIWNKLIVNKKLNGSIIYSKITHVGDKSSFLNI